MGRRPKSQTEVEVFKNKILDATLQLIRKEGYEGFSIRKLGPKLGIAPKTVYNYFKSKEEIYLHVLTRGLDPHPHSARLLHHLPDRRNAL